ncbi:MAG: thiamine pyrophosphate-dependent dehydrogenase E1 component subunit alpha [Chloroflexi bacterium]|nr:thiamine pyrophosphate-dependent dehydrogenase E1 component subunit alpha [Chloroflexota bacterium]
MFDRDLSAVYRQMLRSRLFEEAVKLLWEEGKISGEMHLGIGEEAIAAGVIAHLRDGDAMALDHRCTPPLVVRGVDLVLMLREFMGKGDGLCRGMGGHMHMFSPQHLAASSGIVGSSGPLATGFAMAAQYRNNNCLSLAFFGDGACNQGMLMESFNLAVAWELPVLFVCKDNAWAITTQSSHVTGGNILERARSFGMDSQEVDGTDIEAVYTSAGNAVDRIRNGRGPSFLRAFCPRMQGHYLGDPLRRANMMELTIPLTKAFTTQPGAPVAERSGSLGMLLTLVGKATVEKQLTRNDPITRARNKLKAQKIDISAIDKEVEKEIKQALESALLAE